MVLNALSVMKSSGSSRHLSIPSNYFCGFYDKFSMYFDELTILSN